MPDLGRLVGELGGAGEQRVHSATFFGRRDCREQQDDGFHLLSDEAERGLRRSGKLLDIFQILVEALKDVDRRADGGVTAAELFA